MKTLSSFIYYRLMKWKMIGSFKEDTIKKCIIIVVPHTSWHDFYIGLLVRKIAGIKISFIGKKELFRWPFGWYFKKVGGIPIDRTRGQNKVELIAEEFAKRKELRIALAPEGTRKKVSSWKTGFYYIAQKAQIPIIMVTFDFGKKQNVISAPFYPTDDIESDLAYMYQFFDGVKGKVPEYSFTID
ncbi:1-acyl-sn-glycerol-3-phosphate acyltransferase [Aquimarina hainanensis]|uniref:1-acyl-sn-glycerol-3-phosphate acyltransferase n=1 Tax=Aquimarina hainanensis TaxID=1578017 RepID=A0ABW5NB82_9FLAO|nr:1-acyl-sn-glycerol-3-phosphate acyltransferase [Aquimarina sp. TRL1]QKX06983.1 acyltransferase [Aquimarina sp. TRL1]